METGSQKPEARTQNAEAPPLLDLDAAQRVARIRAGEKIYRHCFKKITQAEWESYAKAAGPVLLQEGNALVPQGGDEAAAWEFWSRNIERVEGYATVDCAVDGWRETVNPNHQLWAVEMLREAFLEEVSDDGEFSVVRLSAHWNERVFDRLIHRFRQPAKQQVLRYRRTGARFLRVGGSRQGATQIVIPSRLAELCRLYDELVVEVEGYAMSPNAGMAAMDALHKSTAVNGLFDPRGLAPASEAAA